MKITTIVMNTRRYGPRPESAAWQDNSSPFS